MWPSMGKLGQSILYIQRLPQRSSDSVVTGPVCIHYDSVSDSTPKQGGQSDHTIRRATSYRELPRGRVRSRTQVKEMCRQLNSNMTQIDLSGTCHSHPIHRFSTSHAYCLWSMHACRCPNNGLPWYTRSITPRPWPLYWWTHSLTNRYLAGGNPWLGNSRPEMISYGLGLG
jgi:hypothetical protein